MDTATSATTSVGGVFFFIQFILVCVVVHKLRKIQKKLAEQTVVSAYPVKSYP